MFDIEAYRATVAPVVTADLDFDAFRSRPLPEDALRCLRYMHDVEGHTVCYLRDLLLTPSHRDPRITTFLTLWNYEEHFHSVALGRVLAAHDEPYGDARTGDVRARLGWADRVTPLVTSVASGLAGDRFVALHMTWGAINEWSTAAGYARLAEQADHPLLTELLGRIQRQEARHIAFYASEARTRLARSAGARRITRAALRRLWAPVGSGVMPAAESAFVLDYLMSGPAGLAAARQIEASLDRLPGLAGLQLVTHALGERHRAA